MLISDDLLSLSFTASEGKWAAEKPCGFSSVFFIVKSGVPSTKPAGLILLLSFSIGMDVLSFSVGLYSSLTLVEGKCTTEKGFAMSFTVFEATLELAISFSLSFLVGSGDSPLIGEIDHLLFSLFIVPLSRKEST